MANKIANKMTNEKKTIKNLKIIRDYFKSGKWKKFGDFNMKHLWKEDTDSGRPCGCVLGHAYFALYNKSSHECYFSLCYKKLGCLNESTLDFLFDGCWAKYDNTVEGAIGRIDAVINGLKF